MIRNGVDASIVERIRSGWKKYCKKGAKLAYKELSVSSHSDNNSTINRLLDTCMSRYKEQIFPDRKAGKQILKESCMRGIEMALGARGDSSLFPVIMNQCDTSYDQEGEFYFKSEAVTNKRWLLQYHKTLVYQKRFCKSAVSITFSSFK